jgi:RNA polymerase sigma factor (sigma-70 family)
MDADPVTAQPRADRPARLAACFERARAGDLAALDEVVDELNPLLWSVARAEGLTHEDAADVVQTTWLELVRQMHTIRSPLALTAWLIQATKREAWHTSARRRKRAGPDVDTLPEVADTAPDPAEQAVNRGAHGVLWEHFAKLSERCKMLLRVVAQADKPDYARIAEALGMPHGSIGPTRGRCLAKLRAMLLADPAWSTE